MLIFKNLVSIKNFKNFYLISLVGSGTCQVCLKMLSEHCNHNADIYNISSVYMADAGSKTIEKTQLYTERSINEAMERKR